MSEHWKHKLRGSVYEVLTHSASLQCSCWPCAEEQFADEAFTVYRSVETGAVYVRPTEEFQDGRFTRIPHDIATPTEASHE